MRRICFTLSVLLILIFTNNKILGEVSADAWVCPTILADGMEIKASDCGKSNGYIKGITAQGEGRVQFIWRDASTNLIVGRNADLNNVAAGRYILQITDESDCTTGTFSPTVTVDENNGIIIDETRRVIKPSSCANDGAVTGISITGANTIEWHSITTGNIVSTTSDLINVPSGSYQLVVSNNFCTKESIIYNINTVIELPIITKSSLYQPTCNNFGSDSIIVELYVSPNVPEMDVMLLNAAGVPVKEGRIIPGSTNYRLKYTTLMEGSYQLSLNYNNCSYIVGNKFTINAAKLVLT